MEDWDHWDENSYMAAMEEECEAHTMQWRQAPSVDEEAPY